MQPQVEITPEIVAEHGLTPDEYQSVLSILGRVPTITELGVFSVMWSEHCSYKNSKPLLKTFPTEAPHILQGPGENAGIVDFDDRLAIVFKMESHNHPSALEPYQGAATGVGGILRDIFTMGARPVALLDPLRFGDPANPRTRHLIRGVVEGIADYGNSVGVPTVGGECCFSPSYDGNPLVNVMCIGTIEKDKIIRAVASGAGNLVVYFGNATGRDGIHGATFASTELTEESEEKRSAVQVGDPFVEKKILEATLELIAAGVLVAIQDMGAAGLTCSTAEMAGRGGMGIDVSLDLVPQRAENLSAYEIMLSESQERMLAICTPEQLVNVEKILNKWDLEAHVLGTLNDTGMMKISHAGEVVANLPADQISENSPVYEREATKPAYMADLPNANDWRPDTDVDLKSEWLAFVASANICSKKWIYEQYDHMVQTQTTTSPGDNAAVLTLHGSDDRLAITTDGNGLYCYVDPCEGGKLAVAEAARNVACSGARPLAITNCLNFGSPLKPEIFFQLSKAVKGIGEACRALNTPVTGGNVSLYNENQNGAIWPTPVIGMVGKISAPTKALKGGFPQAGLEVYLLGRSHSNLGASEYLHWKTGDAYTPCPECDLAQEAALVEILVEGAREGILSSAHDCGVGGLAATLSECFLWSPTNCGAELELNAAEPNLTGVCNVIFGEAAGRVVVSLHPDREEDFLRLCTRYRMELAYLGKTIEEDKLTIAFPTGPVAFSRDELASAYYSMESIFPSTEADVPMH
ncbi:phosphoribosylformylglycinamidine synthase subunit PurL [candidate division BRC1 bacterium HGW-BRC1-1]|jgi:phosphoribosylformylglycinamidine synthase|nr:MAG: phosphoribosylformylglycinamidine synthase subunit PurL [candidate division BRC1 bacterium HGW-BRC1-1]